MKLAEIDPEHVAKTEWSRALEAVHSELQSLAPRSTYTLSLGETDPDWAASIYGHAVYCLARYAKRGEPLDASVHEYCVSLIGPGDKALDLASDGDRDPDTELAVVVVAALARAKIEARRRVTVRELATLAGVTNVYVRKLARDGELTMLDGEFRAAEAKRWLGARGVAGFGA